MARPCVERTLCSADFSGARNLSSDQLGSTLRDKYTRLPEYLTEHQAR